MQVEKASTSWNQPLVPLDPWYLEKAQLMTSLIPWNGDSSLLSPNGIDKYYGWSTNPPNVPRTPPPEIAVAYENHWFPLIRPAIKPLLTCGGYVARGVGWIAMTMGRPVSASGFEPKMSRGASDVEVNRLTAGRREPWNGHGLENSHG